MSDFLLVEVVGGPEMSNNLEAVLLGLRDVASVSVHGEGCCCQHCPHKGNCRD